MTRATFPETTYAVLGLVDKVPGSSGYDLVAIADRSFAHFWPISQTLLYRELNRLAELGWVTAQRIDEGRSPTKWIYQTTPSGQAVLVEWLAKPAERISTFRSGFLLRFFFAHRMPPERVSSLLTDYRAELTAQRDDFAALVDKLAHQSAPAARIGRLAALHGLRTADARLQWTDEAEAELQQQPTR
jgi:PadR family transcriptional regulator, regulatory protein AphA